MIGCATLGSLALLVALPGAEAATPPPIDLEYHAPPGCPDRAAFLAQVQARRLASRPDPRHFVVEITQNAGGVGGDLRVDEAGAPRTIRHLAGATCDEVSLALALTTALALDEPPPAAAAPAPSHPGASLGVRAGAHVAASAGVGPELMVGVPIFVDLALRRPGSRFLPSARLSFEYAAGGGGEAAGQAAFSWTLARLDLCPIDLAITSRLRATPCATIEGGILAASGLAVDDATTARRPWLAPGLTLRLAWDLAADVRVELLADAVAPLIRDTFTIAPDVTVHDVPAFTFTTSIGLSLRLR